MKVEIGTYEHPEEVPFEGWITSVNDKGEKETVTVGKDGRLYGIWVDKGNEVIKKGGE